MNYLKMSLLFSVVLALVGVVGDFFIKISGSGSKFVELKWFIVGLAIYASTAFGWFFVMKYVKLPVLGVFYTVSTVLFLTLVSVFYFKEPLTLYEIIGILFAMGSILLLWNFT